MPARIIALGVTFSLLALSPSAAPKSAFDDCVRKLCTSTSQDGCWVKSGAAMCDRDQISCRDLPDHAPAKALRRVGQRWQVQTEYGNGYVSGRMMMVDGGKCPALLR